MHIYPDRKSNLYIWIWSKMLFFFFNAILIFTLPQHFGWIQIEDIHPVQASPWKVIWDKIVFVSQILSEIFLQLREVFPSCQGLWIKSDARNNYFNFDPKLTTNSSPMPGPGNDDLLLPPLDWAYLPIKFLPANKVFHLNVFRFAFVPANTSRTCQ